MNHRLNDYLQNCEPAQVDETKLDELRNEMKNAVPEIAENIRQREELASELRIAVFKSSSSTRSKNI